jgi:23S rRNA-/tRNA-specific pseudouridylate synthase
MPGVPPLPPILHEDGAMVAFDKPSGLPVASERGDGSRDPLMARVRARMGPHVANVHRLDAGASGILLCAKTKPALDALSGQFQAKTAARRFLALVSVLAPEKVMNAAAPVRAPSGGLPEEFEVDLALGADESRAGRMRVFRGRGGKPSHTAFKVLESFGGFAFVECRPLTGRTHQIRVHLAAAGAPVLNDPLYGDPEERLLLSNLKRRYKGREEERPLISRPALHASDLSILHPSTGAPVAIHAPMPKDFEVAIKYLRKFARNSPV